MMNQMNRTNGQVSPSSFYYPNLGASAPTNNIIWVQGREGANSWQLNPNSIAILLDSMEEGKMYIKTTDNVGLSSLRIFNYTEEKEPIVPKASEETVNNDLDFSQFVKKDELNTFIKELIEEHERTVSGTATAATPTTGIESAKRIDTSF